jgi:hypothetical protein
MLFAITHTRSTFIRKTSSFWLWEHKPYFKLLVITKSTKLPCLIDDHCILERICFTFSQISTVPLFMKSNNMTDLHRKNITRKKTARANDGSCNLSEILLFQTLCYCYYGLILMPVLELIQYRNAEILENTCG